MTAPLTIDRAQQVRLRRELTGKQNARIGRLGASFGFNPSFGAAKPDAQIKDAPKITQAAFTPREGQKLITLMQLTETTCRWPLDTPEGDRFCGLYAEPGQPYCQACRDADRKRPRGYVG